MKKRIFISILLVVILISLTGCNNLSVGIDNYYFIISMGIDKAPNNQITLSIQISSSSSNSSTSSETSQSSDYRIYSVSSNTIEECLTYLNNYLNKELNLSHCSAIIFSEELAKDGIEEYVKTLGNNTELRHSCSLIISSDTALSVIENLTNSGEAFSARLFDYLVSTTEYTGFTIDSTFGDFLKSLDSNLSSPNAIYVNVSNDTVQSDGIAIFNKDKFVKNLNVLDTISYLLITNKLNYSILNIYSPFRTDEFIDLKIRSYKKSNIKISLINNTPFITIDLYPEGTVKSSGSMFNYINNSNISLLEKTTNTYIENNCKEFLYSISKKYNSDIVGFKGLYQAEFFTNEAFDKIHWDNIFSDSFFKVNVHTRINSSSLFSRQ